MKDDGSGDSGGEEPEAKDVMRALTGKSVSDWRQRGRPLRGLSEMESERKTSQRFLSEME